MFTRRRPPDEGACDRDRQSHRSRFEIDIETSECPAPSAVLVRRDTMMPASVVSGTGLGVRENGGGDTPLISEAPQNRPKTNPHLQADRSRDICSGVPTLFLALASVPELVHQADLS